MNGKMALLAGLLCSVTVAGGCATQEAVRKDDQVHAGAPDAAPVAKPDLSPPKEVKDTAVKPVPVALTATAQKPDLSRIDASWGNLESSLHTVFFDFDSALLSENARNYLAQNTSLVKKNPSAHIRVEGNCDERGSDEYNLALGEKRAQAAKTYMVSMGIPAERIATVSYGKEKPAIAGHDESAWAKNRRDDFKIIEK